MNASIAVQKSLYLLHCTPSHFSNKNQQLKTLTRTIPSNLPTCQPQVQSILETRAAARAMVQL